MAASGVVENYVQAFRQMVASCGAVQSWLGVADETAALGEIEIFSTWSGQAPPFLVVDIGEDFGESMPGYAGPRDALGSFLLAMEGAHAAGSYASEVSSREAFYNAVGDVIGEVMEKGAMAEGVPMFEGWNFEMAPDLWGTEWQENLEQRWICQVRFTLKGVSA